MTGDANDTIRADVKAILAGVCKTCHSDSCGECRLYQFDQAMEYRFVDGMTVAEAIRRAEKNVQSARMFRQRQFDEQLPEPVNVCVGGRVR